MKPLTKAIMPVAGLGTRFLPATKAQPKEMLPIVDKPIIQYLVEEAVASGITDIIFVTGRGKRAIEDHFDTISELEQVLWTKGKKELLESVRAISHLARFTYVRQKEPRGDGDAILAAAHLIDPDEPVAILYGDDVVFSATPCLKQMRAIFKQRQASVVAIETVPTKDVSSYGIIGGTRIAPRLFSINKLVEKPSLARAPSRLAIVGKYIITPTVMRVLQGQASTASRTHELRLADALAKIIGTEPLYGYEFIGDRYDCGSKVGFLKATIRVGLTHPETRTEFKKYLISLTKKIPRIPHHY